MDTTLVTVTVLSMGMAATLSVIVWRLLRDERRRSEARVAALTEAAFSSSPTRDAIPQTRDAILPTGGSYTPVHKPVPVKQIPVVSAPPPARPVVSALPGLSERQRVEGKRNDEHAPAAADDLLLHPERPAVATTALFAEPARTSPWGSRFVVMAALALVGTSVLFVAMTMTRPSAPAAAKSAPAAPAAERAAAGLELLSLRDSRDAGALTITGMVQNPRTGSLLSRVAVTAYAFDDKGAFLASGRALLDVTSLAPGDGSPFVVTVPVTGTVARYRIGFRGEDGRVIAHVDKRQQSPMAANW
jgi:hypothetical protein